MSPLEEQQVCHHICTVSTFRCSTSEGKESVGGFFCCCWVFVVLFWFLRFFKSLHMIPSRICQCCSNSPEDLQTWQINTPPPRIVTLTHPFKSVSSVFLYQLVSKLTESFQHSLSLSKDYFRLQYWHFVHYFRNLFEYDTLSYH